jgi:CIC family chloride channel protein
VHHDYTYLLLAVLRVAAGLVGFGFKTVLYRLEDVVDRLWKGRPEWATGRGASGPGGHAAGPPPDVRRRLPVVDKAIAGHTVLWLLVILMLGKVLAVGLTLSIGGSGGCSPRRCSPGPWPERPSG